MLLFVVEGPDGVGKTTAARKLHQALLADGIPALLEREPTTDDVRKVLGSQTSELARLYTFLGDRLQHIETLVRVKQSGMKVVVLDRFSMSTIVNQGHLPGASRMVEDVDSLIPIDFDVVYDVLLAPLPALLERQQGDRQQDLKDPDAKTLEAHLATYQRFAAGAGPRGIRFNDIAALHASGPIEGVVESLRRHVHTRLQLV